MSFTSKKEPTANSQPTPAPLLFIKVIAGPGSARYITVNNQRFLMDDSYVVGAKKGRGDLIEAVNKVIQAGKVENLYQNVTQ